MILKLLIKHLKLSQNKKSFSSYQYPHNQQHPTLSHKFFQIIIPPNLFTSESQNYLLYENCNQKFIFFNFFSLFISNMSGFQLGSANLDHIPYFVVPATDCISFSDCSMIWCFKMTTSLSIKHKTMMKRQTITRRNYSIILYLIEMITVIIRMVFSMVRGARFIGFFNIYIMIISILGLYGTLTFKMIPMISYMAGMIAGLSILFILIVLSILASSETNQSVVEIFWVYIPVFVDVFYVIGQATFIVPTI